MCLWNFSGHLDSKKPRGLDSFAFSTGSGTYKPKWCRAPATVLVPLRPAPVTRTSFRGIVVSLAASSRCSESVDTHAPSRLVGMAAGSPNSSVDTSGPRDSTSAAHERRPSAGNPAYADRATACSDPPSEPVVAATPRHGSAPRSRQAEPAPGPLHPRKTTTRPGRARTAAHTPG